MEIKSLYAKLYEAGFNKDQVGSIMSHLAGLVGAWSIGDVTENQFSVMAQMIEDYKNRLYRVRKGMDWKTGDVL